MLTALTLPHIGLALLLLTALPILKHLRSANHEEES